MSRTVRDSELTSGNEVDYRIWPSLLRDDVELWNRLDERLDTALDLRHIIKRPMDIYYRREDGSALPPQAPRIFKAVASAAFRKGTRRRKLKKRAKVSKRVRIARKTSAPKSHGSPPSVPIEARRVAVQEEATEGVYTYPFSPEDVKDLPPGSFTFSMPLDVQLPGHSGPPLTELSVAPSGPDGWKCKLCGEDNPVGAKSCKWCLFSKPDRRLSKAIRKLIEKQSSTLEKGKEKGWQKKRARRNDMRESKRRKKVQQKKKHKKKKVNGKKKQKKTRKADNAHKQLGNSMATPLSGKEENAGASNEPKSQTVKKCRACQFPNPTALETCAFCQSSLSDPSPPMVYWWCKRCRVENRANAFHCAHCNATRLGHELVVSMEDLHREAAVGDKSFTYKRPLDDSWNSVSKWHCTICLAVNMGGNRCFACKSLKPGNTVKPVSLFAEKKRRVDVTACSIAPTVAVQESAKVAEGSQTDKAVLKTAEPSLAASLVIPIGTQPSSSVARIGCSQVNAREQPDKASNKLVEKSSAIRPLMTEKTCPLPILGKSVEATSKFSARLQPVASSTPVLQRLPFIANKIGSSEPTVSGTDKATVAVPEPLTFGVNKTTRTATSGPLTFGSSSVIAASLQPASFGTDKLSAATPRPRTFGFATAATVVSQPLAAGTNKSPIAATSVGSASEQFTFGTSNRTTAMTEPSTFDVQKMTVSKPFEFGSKQTITSAPFMFGSSKGTKEPFVFDSKPTRSSVIESNGFCQKTGGREAQPTSAAFNLPSTADQQDPRSTVAKAKRVIQSISKSADQQISPTAAAEGDSETLQCGSPSSLPRSTAEHTVRAVWFTYSPSSPASERGPPATVTEGNRKWRKHKSYREVTRMITEATEGATEPVVIGAKEECRPKIDTRLKAATLLLGERIRTIIRNDSNLPSSRLS